MTAMPHRPGLFVTGTDTGVGKTWVSVALLRALRRAGHTAVGMKPVATGCSLHQSVLANEDALSLQANSALALDYAQVNPYAFAPPVAPHIAARLAGARIDLDAIAACCDQLLEIADTVVVEGVGGWLVPLNEADDVAALARRLALPVVLVVGLRLGCINHALLTVRAIQAQGSLLAGWVANSIDPDLPYSAENVDSLMSRIGAPCLGILPYAGAAVEAEWLDLAERSLFAGLDRAGLLQSLGA